MEIDNMNAVLIIALVSIIINTLVYFICWRRDTEIKELNKYLDAYAFEINYWKEKVATKNDQIKKLEEKIEKLKESK